MDPSPQSTPPNQPRPGPLPPPRQGRAPRAHAEEKRENYSYDEMMSRLRGGSGESSPGGKRKRRSVQQGGKKKGVSEGFEKKPNYGGLGLSRRGLWILAGAVLLLGTGIACFFGYRWLTRFRLEGAGFQVNVGRRLSELFERPVTLSRFRQGPVRDLTNSSVTLDGRYSDLLEKAAFNDVQITLSPASWMGGGDWDITTLRVREGVLQLNPHRAPADAMLLQPVSRTVETGGGFGVSSNPSRISVETGMFDGLTLKWPGPDGKPGVLRNLAGSFRLGTGVLDTEIKGGELDTGEWPPFRVEWLKTRLSGGTELEIVESRLALAERGQARLRGRASLVPEGGVSLSGDIDPVQIRALIPESWGMRVLGLFSSPSVTWESKFKAGPPAELKGPFLVQGLALRGMPFLDKFASLVRRAEYQLLEFPELRGEFSWTPERTVLTGLKAERPGLVRFSGDVEISSSGLVKGHFRMQVSDLQFVGLKGGRPAFFTRAEEEGWSALEFDVSGSPEILTDSLAMEAPASLAPPRATGEEPAARTAPPPPANPPGPAVIAEPLAPPPPSKAPSPPVDSEKLFNELIGK